MTLPEIERIVQDLKHGMNHSEAHQSLANEAFSKSGASGLYDRARPTYPIEIELGAGTGIFTRALLYNSKPGQIKKWNAIEPAAGMRESFNRWLSSYTLEGTSINCDHGSIDMVIAAQAWHWTGSDPEFQEKCIQEVQRVLKSKGYFVLIWNLKDRERYEWVGRIRDSYELYESGTPQYRLGLWKTLFQTKTFKSSFKLLPPDEVPNPSNTTTTLTFNKNVDDRIDDSIPTLTVLTETPLTLEGLQARILSKSYITVLGSDKQERLRDEIKSIWDHHLVGNLTTDWIDEKTVKFPYVTHLYVLKKW
ncbi:hypothetical protein DFH28DRAFT_1103457 [Melampsora americana]|nr:hypothetical protein DFH28DRAFT_1103457 [Melampsora americana]